MATKKSLQPANYHDQPSEAPKSGHSGLEPDVEFAGQGALDYDHDAMLNSPTRTGLQAKGTKHGPGGTPSTDQQLGGGRSIDLNGRPKL